MSKSPLNDRAKAERYTRDELCAYAAQFLRDGAAALPAQALDTMTRTALADWDARMADPARALPDGSPPSKRKEADYAIMHAFHGYYNDERKGAGQ